MIKDLRYNGFTSQPSDYECPDGDLEAAVNLLNEDGVIKPILPAQEKFSLNFTWEKGEEVQTATLDKVVCIHKVGVHSNYIFALQDEEKTSRWYVLYTLGEPTQELHTGDITDILAETESNAPSLGGGATTIEPVKPKLNVDSIIEDDESGFGSNGIPGIGSSEDEPGEDENPDPIKPIDPYIDPEDEDAGMDDESEGEEDIYPDGSKDTDETIWGDGTLYYLKDENGKVASFEDIKGFEIVGNIVIILTEGGMHYLLFEVAKDKNINRYSYLGTHLPEIDIRFALKEHYNNYGYGKWAPAGSEDATRADFPKVWIPRKYLVEEGERWTLTGDTYDFDNLGIDDINKLKDAVKAAANKASVRYATKENRFQYPFFIRFAYRLYDGSLTMHSAPILMPANVGTQNLPFPLVSIDNYFDDSQGEGDARITGVIVHLLTHHIQYMLGGSITKLLRWQDIIKSVDVFVSAPIYTYDQAGKKFEKSSLQTLLGETYSLTQSLDNSLHKYTKLRDSVGNHSRQSDSHITSDVRSRGFYHETVYTYDSYDNVRAVSTSENPDYIKLPSFSADDISDKVKNCANFYLWKSLTLRELEKVTPFEYQDLTVKEGYMQSLTEREIMTDDYFSHCEEIPGLLHTYNARLNKAGVQRKAYTNCYFNNFFCYTDGIIAKEKVEDGVVVTDESNNAVMEGETPGKNLMFVRFYVHIRRDKNIIVRSYAGYMNDRSPLPYFFYPDPAAYKVVFECRKVYKTYKGEDKYDISTSKTATFYEIELQEHSGLNGAVWFDNFRTALSEKNKIKRASGNIQSGRDDIKENTRYSQGKDLLENIGNKLYTSEVNNPFLFSPKNVTTVGNGIILGLAAAVRALSQGQFGQFPLYAFTTEGVWSLETSTTGSFSARQPITRDVVLGDGRSITSLDTSVLFATERGIMQLGGSSTVCISDEIKNLEKKVLPLSKIGGEDIEIAPFREFLQECRMIYDYTNQRVIVYNPNIQGGGALYPYAYVYSLKSRKWGLMQSGVLYSLNSYPDAYAVQEGKVVDVSPDAIDNSLDNSLAGIKGLLMTRPLKLDNGDVLKTIDTIIQRGYFRNGSIEGCTLYGSRDLFTWYKIWSSRDHYLRGFSGTPYKYFKIELSCNFSPTESLTGCTVRFTPRYINKPR